MLGLSDDFQWVDLISIGYGHMYRFIYNWSQISNFYLTVWSNNKVKTNKQLISAIKICLKGNITIPLQ